MNSRAENPRTLLFLIGDTGGGHRSAAQAVSQALDHAFPGHFAPVICDPLRGPGAPGRLRWLVALYGPCIRLTPWLWGMLWRSCDSPRALGWARRTLLSPANRTVAGLVVAHRPVMIVAFHPMTAEPAVRARDRIAPAAPVITVITDLITSHLAWRDAAVDRVVVPSAAVGRRCAQDGLPDGHQAELGIPVGTEFVAAPARLTERRLLQRSLGLRGRFMVLVTGGAEGSGGLYRRAEALLRGVPDVDVAVICGRNRRLRRRLDRLATRAAGRLCVRGFVDNMADWMRCADVVVGKAGPGTIAEAACCGAPVVLTSYLPGQEEGNAEFVVGAGAGRYAPRRRDLVAEIRWLRDNPAALTAMRTAAASLGRPGAADAIARLLAGLAGPPGPPATQARQPAILRAGRPAETGVTPEIPARGGLAVRRAGLGGSRGSGR